LFLFLSGVLIEPNRQPNLHESLICLLWSGSETTLFPEAHKENMLAFDIGNPIADLPSERKAGPQFPTDVVCDLVRTAADFKDDVMKWCDPHSRDATLARCGHISDWDTSQVTDCEELFKGQRVFNDDISRWNTSNVTNMRGMFAGAAAFNQPIGDWNVSNVQSMGCMFQFAKAFNQPIGGWDVSKVQNMEYMFCGAKAFDQHMGCWNVSNVTNMRYMFDHATNFDKPIGDWEVSKVTDMVSMFQCALKFNQPLGNWKLSKNLSAEKKKWMFKSCPIRGANKPPGSGWGWGCCGREMAAEIVGGILLGCLRGLA